MPFYIVNCPHNEMKTVSKLFRFSFVSSRSFQPNFFSKFFKATGS